MTGGDRQGEMLFSIIPCRRSRFISSPMNLLCSVEYCLLLSLIGLAVESIPRNSVPGSATNLADYSLGGE